MSTTHHEFERGRHEWFALRRIITNPRNSALPGGFWNRFIWETSQVDGRTKDWIMKRLLHGPSRHRHSQTDEPIQNGRPIDPIASYCGLALFCLSFFPCRHFYSENFVSLFCEIKLLFTYLLAVMTRISTLNLCIPTSCRIIREHF